MKVKLTDRLVTTVKATGPQTEYFDEALTGLALRVTPPVKAWTYHATLEGKRLRCPLGTPTARTKALEAKAAIEEGRDPPRCTSWRAALLAGRHVQR
jgi:hypothetical protein